MFYICEGTSKVPFIFGFIFLAFHVPCQQVCQVYVRKFLLPPFKKVKLMTKAVGLVSVSYSVLREYFKMNIAGGEKNK